MNHIRAEALQFSESTIAVTHVADVEAQILLQPQRTRPQCEFHATHAACVPAACFRAGVDAQERITMLPGIALQHAAGQGDTVDFV
jgi:hypothetical protein